jgi:hypothetical protein
VVHPDKPEFDDVFSVGVIPDEAKDFEQKNKQ